MVFAKDQPPYLPLPALVVPNDDGPVTFCWRLGVFERLHVLLTGRVWHQVLTFGKPLQPQKLTTNRPAS